ncbi:MAG TPA: GxxExxY protein [Acidobacteriota bacterium]|nr:GxxExxY protein [Acidobacteriota bacterium]
MIVEIKANERITKVCEAELMNYLHATNIEIGMLLNFGPEPKFVRKIFTNDRKNSTRILTD